MEILISLGFGWGLWLCVDGWRNPVLSRQDRPERTSSAARLLAVAGMATVRPSRLWFASGVCGVLAAIAAALTTRILILALLAGIAAAFAPIAFLRSRATRRHKDHAEAWPDAIDHLASAIRAGLSLPEALTSLGTRGPEHLRADFTAFGRDYQSSGRFADALDRLKDRLGDPVGDRVIEALRIARDVGGGDIGRMLRTLSAFLRDDLRTRAELEARQSWTVSGARLAVASPWLVLAMMSMRSDAIAQFTTATGTLLLVTGAIVCVVAYRLMMRLGRLPRVERVLS